MLDHTHPPELAESIKSVPLDAPAGSTIIRVEPVIPAGNWDKGLMVDVVAVVNGRKETARLDMGYKTHPFASWAFPSLDGAKIEAEARPVGGKAEIGLRVTCGNAENMPAKLERPNKGK